MKRKLLFFVSLLSTSLTLTACGGFGEGGEGGGNSITLPNTAQEAANMFYQFATSTGVEITYRAYDDESNEPETNTIGFKNDVFWVKESLAYKKVGTTLEMYEYDVEKQSYEYQVSVTESEQTSLDLILKNFSSVFYAGYEYATQQGVGSFTSKKDVTFLTRPATEYTLAYSDGVNQASLNIIFDNATGITLKIYATASSSSDGSSAEYEVTSFAVGNAVIVPTLNKSSGQGGEGQGGSGEGGQGGEGQGGEGQGGEGGQTDVDYFSNKLLMYVGNQGYNVFNGSNLSLFSDGKFELSFLQNGYAVVFFGTYTVGSSKVSAMLVTERVYKDQTKETSSITQTWTLDYSNGAYTLAVSTTGKVFYNASGAAPTHYVIPGEGGQTGDVENFVNHAFVYYSQQSAPNFVNSTIALFDDDTFEIVTLVNGKKIVYLGSYTVNTSDTEASLTVARVYNEASNSYSDGVGNWKLGIQKNGSYHLAMPGATVIYNISDNAPVRADIPADEGQGQTDDDAKYKVNEATWNEMIVNRGLISLSSNFTMVTSDASGQTKYEFDSGKVHYTFTSSSFTNEMFYEFTSLSSGTFYYKNEGKWEKQDAPADMHLTFDDYIGVLPVPYNKVSFNSTSYYYGCNEWKDEQQDAYQNPRFYFEEGNLIKTTYKHWNVDYLFTFNAHGTTSITLPEVSGGGSQTDDNARYKITATLWENLIIDGGLVDLDSNFTAMVTTSDNQRGYTKYEFDEGNICVYTVDPDGTISQYYAEYENAQRGYQYRLNESGVWEKVEYTFGIGGYMNSLGILAVEFSSLTFNETTHEYDLRSWTNGSGNQFTDIHFSFDNNKLKKMRYSGQFASREVEFDKYGATSVTLPEVGGGGQQDESKWPADEIAAKLAQLDLAVSIPAPSVADESIDSVSVNAPADNSGLSIVITLTDTNNIAQLIYGYMGGFQGFEADYFESDFSEDGNSGTYALLNETRDIIIKLTYDLNSPVFSIFVAKFTGNPYPADKIAAFFDELELEVSFPDLSMNNVSYSFKSSAEEGFGMLMMTPMGDNTTEAIVSCVETALARSEFSVVYKYYEEGDESELYATYLDPTLTYTVEFYEYDGQVYLNININEEDPTENISFDYPQEQIEALIPEDFDGIVPSFETRGAIYRVEEIEGGFSLQISLQSGMNAAGVMRTLANALTGEQYALNNDGGYESQDGQVVVFLNNIENKLITVEVFFVEQEEPPIEEPVEVTYTFVCDNDWDITVDDAVIYAYMWKENGDYQWVELTAEKSEENGLYFTLETDNSWVGMKIVRFAPDSEIGWKYGPNGQVNENVTIWNETDDIKLNGEGGELHFSLHDVEY